MSGRLAAAAARPEQTPANMKTEPSPAAFVLIPRLVDTGGFGAAETGIYS